MMARMKRLLLAAAALVLAACGGGGGGGDSTPSMPTTPTPSANTSDPAVYSSLALASLTTPNELTAVTHHQLVLAGTTLNYTATVGHMTALSQGANLPEASFFYVAYTLDGADLNTRPVTFFYNGGPGSATVWLHLGSFGPKRLAVNAPSTTTPTPFALVDNAESLLDKSDLVFVDAVGTGFSEAIAPNTNSTFWGVDVDAAVFRDFVMRYVAVNSRATSPKFLFSESYGTPRSAVLANLLETAGTSLKGVVLQSSILNYNTNCGIFDTAVISCFGFIPSYAAVGAWLTLVQPPEGVAQLPAFTQQVRSFAIGTYDPAVSRWMLNHAAPDQGVVGTLVADTGMSAINWNGTHFNMDPGYFHDNLVPGSVLGFYDGRMVAARGTPLAADDDPSTTMYDSSFATTIVSYLTDLHYTNGSAYTVLGNAINSWNFHHNGQALPDTVPDLAAAFVRNPKLKVFSANGYHDMVTPFYVTENDITRFNNNPNISVHIYQGGHMTYLDDTGRAQEKADLAAFYAGAVAAKSAEVLPPVIAPTKPETPAYPGVMPPAKFETKLRDPALPEALRGIVPTPPPRGIAD
jgi:carboxypeptidase C (cathepsin A)